MKRTIYNCVCGGKARSVAKERDPECRDFGPGYTHWAEVECRKCGMTGPKVDTFEDKESQAKAKAEAVDKWNALMKKSGVSEYTTYTDCILPPGADPATDKQIKYAEAIADRLGIKLPREKSKEEYRRFISEHVEEFRAKRPRFEYHPPTSYSGTSCLYGYGSRSGEYGRRLEREKELKEEIEQLKEENSRGSWTFHGTGYYDDGADDTHIGPP